MGFFDMKSAVFWSLFPTISWTFYDFSIVFVDFSLILVHFSSIFAQFSSFFVIFSRIFSVISGNYRPIIGQLLDNYRVINPQVPLGDPGLDGRGLWRVRRVPRGRARAVHRGGADQRHDRPVGGSGWVAVGVRRVRRVRRFEVVA
jgi:hypothetical protein